jgi:23S rRNA (cytosine1962-C5)-methyltransferase
MSDVVVNRRAEERARLGHPWIYRSDIASVNADGGDIVRVVGSRERVLGYALYSSRSEIALRLMTRGDVPVDLGTWRARIHQAVTFRESLRIDATAYRLIHAEGDLLPSLVVDRYADYLVLQTLSQATDRLIPEIVQLLVDVVRPSGILARNDPRVRTLEGLEQHVVVVHGTVPESIPVRDGRPDCSWTSERTGSPRPRTPEDACSMASATTAGLHWRSRRHAMKCSPWIFPMPP